MISFKKKNILVVPFITFLLVCNTTTFQNKSFINWLKSSVPPLLKKYKVPGISIAIVEHLRVSGKFVFGKRKLGSKMKINEETIFEACSMSKPVFSFAVLKLKEKGKFDINKPLDSYLKKPFVKGDKRSRLVTARMVMTHTTGLPNWRRKKPLKFISDPGKKYTYSGEGFTWLTKAIKSIVGKDLNSWLKKNLLIPIGMKRSSYIWEKNFERNFAWGHGYYGDVKKRSPFKKVNAAYSLYTTPTDYAKFIITVMKQCKKGYIKLMVEPIFRIGKDKYRSMGFVIEKKGNIRLISHTGHNGTGFTCYTLFCPEKKTGIVVMTNAESGKKVCKFIIDKFLNTI